MKALILDVPLLSLPFPEFNNLTLMMRHNQLTCNQMSADCLIVLSRYNQQMFLISQARHCSTLLQRCTAESWPLAPELAAG